MTNLDISEIEQSYAEWSKMDNTAKLTWLTKEKIQLNGLANRMAQHVSANGGFINDAERAEARLLLEMIQYVDAEGTKILDDIRNDAFKEILKAMMK